MSKPDDPGVMQASMVFVLHAGQSGRKMIMMLALAQAGAQHSQSPVDAVTGGDGIAWRGTNLHPCSILLSSSKFTKKLTNWDN
jgi:hypothetical protein